MRCLTSAFMTLLCAGLLVSCGDSGGDSSSSASGTAGTASTASTANTGAATAATENGCENAGGVCSCAGSCNEGFMLAEPPLLDQCPQPPDESGACSQQCCIPVEGMTSSSSTSPGSSSGPGRCDCADLPLCMTSGEEECAGVYPEDHCCDPTGLAFSCDCIDPCTGGNPCCTLVEGCL